MAVYILCLIILMVITLFSLLTGNNLITLTIEQSLNYQQALNGSVSEVDLGSISSTLYLDPLIQAIIWITIIGLIATGSAINVLSSGLSEYGSHWLTYMIFYTSIWIILSALSFPLISAIQTFGTIIYLSLTIVYSISVIIHIGRTG